MNQGIFGFPTALSNTIISTTEIDVSGTYRIAPGTKRLVIFAIGAGAGGGSGGRRASGTTQSGGGGGHQGAIIIESFNVEDLGVVNGVNTTLSIIIGAGSVGGVGSSDNNLPGSQSVGTAGTTSISVTGNPGILISCLGGQNGGGGSTGTPTNNGVRTGFVNGILVSNVYPTNTTGVMGQSVNVLNMLYSSGAQGGGLSLEVTPTEGGSINSGISTSTFVANPNFATTVYTGGSLIAPLVTPVNSTHQVHGKMSPGFGGPGGGSGFTVGGQTGGNGYRGSGGGGGGCCLNGFTSGSGGRGGNGYVCIVALS